MKFIYRIVLMFCLSIFLLDSCTSVKKYNQEIVTLKSVEQLKADVDYANKKLHKLQPRLDWYVSEKDLNYKFDSLKATITKPMTSNEFFFKLSPVISAIKQGHTKLSPINKRLEKKELIIYSNKGYTPFSRLGFETFDNKIYIVKNFSEDSTLKIGTEIVTINNIPPQEILAKYQNTYASDGFNQTFINYLHSRGLAGFFYNEYDVTDSVLCQLKYNDSIKTVYLKSQYPKRISKPKPKTDSAKIAERLKLKKELQKRRELGYEPFTKQYNRSLAFYETDSSVAVMKIRNFSSGNYKLFYKNSFKKLEDLKTNTLVIDLRSNPGGALRDIQELYSYLTDSTFIFIDKSEVVSRTSITHMRAFKNLSLFGKTLYIALYPIPLTFNLIQILKVKKDTDNKYYYKFRSTKVSKPKPNNFKGKLYILINGGSFSASCIISSNLKSTKRAVFVGEETGGAYNGCVAGIMPVYKLPNTKLPLRLCLATIVPHYKTNSEGHGIFPDVEIQPTMQDKISGNDPELNWVFDDIKKAK